MRCEEKIANGKLVCVEVMAKDGLVSQVTISGDFFLHPEDAIGAIERSLCGMRLDSSEAAVAAAVENVLSESGAVLLGASAPDIARLFVKAVA